MTEVGSKMEFELKMSKLEFKMSMLGYKMSKLGENEQVLVPKD